MTTATASPGRLKLHSYKTIPNKERPRVVKYTYNYLHLAYKWSCNLGASKWTALNWLFDSSGSNSLVISLQHWTSDFLCSPFNFFTTCKSIQITTRARAIQKAILESKRWMSVFYSGVSTIINTPARSYGIWMTINYRLKLHPNCKKTIPPQSISAFLLMCF